MSLCLSQPSCSASSLSHDVSETQWGPLPQPPPSIPQTWVAAQERKGSLPEAATRWTQAFKLLRMLVFPSYSLTTFEQTALCSIQECLTTLRVCGFIMLRYFQETLAREIHNLQKDDESGLLGLPDRGKIWKSS